MEPMTGLLYKSVAARTLAPLETELLLRKARIRNTRERLSGVLLYSDYFFMQYLEGPTGAVNRLYDEIARDPRHRAVQMLWHEPVTHREFAEWSMAYRPLLTTDAAVEARCWLLGSAPEPSQLGVPRQMLLKFLDTGRVKPALYDLGT